GLNHRKAGASMAKYLLDRGYRKFGYLGVDLKLDKAAARRLQGLQSTLRSAQSKILTKLTVPTPSGIGLGRHNMERLLEQAPDLEVVYFSDDAVAAGALMYCMAHGIDVPSELAIASFSGLELAAAMPITLTTIRSPRYEIGRSSVNLILDRIEGRATPQKTDLGFELVSGDST
ncbi:MAG: substrate-binding domain-containing protein, partial [Hyphomicrobiaceae bacterium]